MKTKTSAISPVRWLASLNLIALLLASNALGAVFTNAIDGNWNTAVNWRPNGVPGGSVALLFDVGCSPNVTNNIAAYTAGAITVSNTINVFGGDLTNANITYGSGGINGTATFNLNLDNGGTTRTFGPNTGKHIVVNGVISGAGGLIRGNANGNLTLNNTNTFTGQFDGRGASVLINTIGNAGTAQSLGAGTAAIILGSGANDCTLNYNGGTPVPAITDRQIQIGNATAANAGGAIIINNGTNALIFTHANFNAPVAGITVERSVYLQGGSLSTNEVKGIIADNDTASGGIVSFTKTGTGTWILSGANTYSGPTTNKFSGSMLILKNVHAIPGGIGATGGSNNLVLANGAMLGLAASDLRRSLGTGAGQVQIQAGGSFAAYGADRIVNFGGASAPVTWGVGSFIPSGSWLNFGADTTYGVPSDKTIDFQNPIDLNGANQTVNVFNGTADVDGIISGIVSDSVGGSILVKTGAGALVLGGLNTFSGQMQINKGSVSVSTIANAGVASGVGTGNSSSVIRMGNTTDNGVLIYTGGAASTDRQIQVGNGAIAAHAGQANIKNNGSGALVFTAANLNVADTGAITNRQLVLSGSNTDTNEIQGIIADNNAGGGGTVGVSKSEAGKWILSGNNTYSGDTILSGGTLVIGRVGGAIPDVSKLTFGGGTLDVANSDTAGDVAMWGAGSAISGAGTLTIGSLANTAGVGSNTISATVVGSGALTKIYAATLIISGANTYAGGSTISGGTLLVNGSLSGGSVVASNNFTVLGGSGVINGSVSVVSNATLRPGLSGTDTSPLTINGSLNLSGTMLITINRTNTPNTATVTGITALTLGGTLTVANHGPALQAGDSFQLFAAGSVTGLFAATNVPALDPGLAWDDSGVMTNGTLKVVSSYATTPTNIVFSATSTTLSLTWPGSHLGWYAQSNAVDIADTNYWFNIPGSETVTNLDLTIDPAQSNVFYRLRMP